MNTLFRCIRPIKQPKTLLNNWSKNMYCKQLINATYIDKNGKEIKVQAESGTNMLAVAHDNDIDLEGACECSCACSTCHVYVDNKYYHNLPEATDEENDMLDLAFSLRENSRLGCQIILNEETDGITVTLPPATRNMYVDGHTPPKH